MSRITFKSGMKLLRSKNYEAVYTQSVEALKKNEKNPLPFFLLGMLAVQSGNHAKALELFAKAAEHGPTHVHYQTYYAKTLVAMGHNEQAKSRADKAAALGTTDALLADMIGVVYSRTGYHDLAIPLFKKAVRLNPKWANFHFNLGASAEFTGDLETAKTAYKQVIALDPKFYLAWYALIALEKQTQKSNHLETLKTLFQTAPNDPQVRLLLGHAIAKTLEDLEQFEQSFIWLKRAKSLKLSQIGEQHKGAETIFKAAIAAPLFHSKDPAYRAKPSLGTPTRATPIFVVGMPRTGTTLVDRILSSHPQISSAGELTLFSNLIQHATSTPIGMQINAETFLKARDINLENVGRKYIQETIGLARGATHFIDKMPLNFFYLGLIHQALPDAKIIVLRRGAMDSCLSNYRQIFAGHTRNYDYSFDLQDTAAFYRAFDGLIAHWRGHISSDQFMEVAYEDIVLDQENQTRALIDFCGVNWDQACMRFTDNAAPVATASAVQVRRPLYSSSIGRWKKYGHKLDALQVALGALAEED